MTNAQSLELLAFDFRSGGRTRVLVSAGSPADKQRLLPAIRQLQELNAGLYATPGTYRFLKEHGIDSQEVNKISDGRTPNILTFLNEERFDLVINILTGDRDYDEASDVKLIRSLAVRNMSPLVTDVDVAIETLAQVVSRARSGANRYKLNDASEPWNLQRAFTEQIGPLGGLASHHAHLDKAYLITKEYLQLSQVDMQYKWKLYRNLKESYTMETLVERIGRGVEMMIRQGMTYSRTMVDADSIVGLLPVKAALEVKKRYEGQIVFEVGVQPLEGVLDSATFEQYHEACELADYCGGLPSRDSDKHRAETGVRDLEKAAEHMDVILKLAKQLGKCVDVHVDQENNPEEVETEMLALKTIEHGMQGRVFGVHAISVSAKEEEEQDRIIAKVKEADMGIIICPSAALSMKQLPMHAPLHNSIAPYVKMKEAGVRTYFGIDNIHDLFMPIVDGDVWTEARLFMEAVRFYDIDAVAQWACAKTPEQAEKVAQLLRRRAA